MSHFLPVDFSRVPAPGWWAPHLQGMDVVVNAVGIFDERGTQTFEALHTRAPIALFEGCVQAGVPRVVQVSALGSDAQARTAYHLSKRAADDALRALPLASAIVQPSLVYAPDGASAGFFNKLAVLPLLVLPRGPQVQPVHVEDVIDGLLALCQQAAAPAGTFAFVGPRPLALPDYLAGLRRGLGRAGRAWRVELPGRWCLGLAWVAERLGVGFVSRDAVSMLLRGNVADPAAFARLLGRPPRPVEAFIDSAAAPGLYRDTVLDLLRPFMVGAIALVWVWTGLVSMGLYPVADSLALLHRFGLHGGLAVLALYGAALLDLALGVLTWTTRGRLRQRVLLVQLLVISGYTVMITARLPEWWLHPYGPISKNLPMVVLIALLLALEPAPPPQPAKPTQPGKPAR